MGPNLLKKGIPAIDQILFGTLTLGDTLHFTFTCTIKVTYNLSI